MNIKQDKAKNTISYIYRILIAPVKIFMDGVFFLMDGFLRIDRHRDVYFII